jgi:hypothetical protein
MIRCFKDVDLLSDFPEYGADDKGNIYTYKTKDKKPRKLKPQKSHERHKGRLSVKLTDKTGHLSGFLVHRLIAYTFIPDMDFRLQVRHLDGNPKNNNLSNLEVFNSPARPRKSKYRDASPIAPSTDVVIDNRVLDETIINNLRTIHRASISKGIGVDDAISFSQDLITEALKDYVRKYSLHRVDASLTSLLQ